MLSDADYNSCLDCGSVLVPCTCRPDCPGGMCPANCDEDDQLVTCPACSGEGCGEYARLTDADNRCDGHGQVTASKRRLILLRNQIDRLARQGIYKR